LGIELERAVATTNPWFIYVIIRSWIPLSEMLSTRDLTLVQYCLELSPRAWPDRMKHKALLAESCTASHHLAPLVAPSMKQGDI
jgi:hypothetical protein